MKPPTVVFCLVAGLMLLPATAGANTIESSTMHFQGTLTDAGGGVYTGTIPMTAGEYYVPGGPGEAISTGGGFDVYAKEGGCAYVQGYYGTGAWNCAGIDTAAVGANHDAYPEDGPWGAWWDPDCADWNVYELELTAGHWYLRYAPTGESPMSGTMDWANLYAAESDLGTQDGSEPGGSAAHGGGPAAWDWDCGWGVEAIPLEVAGFKVTVTDLGGGQYHVILAPEQVLEVSQPVQVTSDDYYERGQAVVYDGTNYWLFYGRSASVTVPYSGGNPDIHDYAIYYKKATSVAGLAAAIPTAVPGATSCYLGETGAAVVDGKVWTFATVPSTTYAGRRSLYGWYTTTGASWTQVADLADNMPDGAAHHDEVGFEVSSEDRLYVMVNYADGNNGWYTKYTDDTTAGTITWSAYKPLATPDLINGTGHFFVDNGIELYIGLLRTSPTIDNKLLEYVPAGDTWNEIATASSTGWDGTFFKVGSGYMFAQAPWVGAESRQYIYAWANNTLDSTFFDNGSKTVTEGQYGTEKWVDMWPIGFTDNDGDTYLFYTSERKPGAPGTEITGNIWYLKVDWDVNYDHHTYIQEAIDAATGTTINVAAGTYDETLNIEGFAGLTINGADKNTVTYAPTSTQDWGMYGGARQTAIRVMSSTDVVLRNMTMDFVGSTGNNHAGILYWDSTGEISNNILENVSLPDASSYYYELTAYLRAPSYTDVARAAITVSDNEFIDTGRLGVVTHQYVDVAITGNTFHKTSDDFGYAMELGSESVATVTGNTIYGYDTPAAVDGSSSAGIYVENSFTGATPAMTKNVSISGNEIYDCQYALWIGNGADGYAGPVALVADVSGNNLHDNVEGAVLLQDEDAEYGSSVQAAFQGNTVTNNGEVGYFIYTAGDGNITATLTGETITGHDIGVYLNDYAAVPPSASVYDITVSQSTITGNALYGVQNEYADTVISAPQNWWGSYDGPEDSDSGTQEITRETCDDYTVPELLNAVGEFSGALGDKVSDNVDYCSWYECLTWVECYDGLFCNGEEICTGHTCDRLPRACAPGWCDEIDDMCREHGDGDFDGDNDVDLADFADFQMCFAEMAGPGCYAGNMTGSDGMVDLDDYVEFQAVLAGP